MRDHLVDVAMKAARSLLVIVPSPPHDKGYPEFKDKVRNYNMGDPFNFPNRLPFAKVSSSVLSIKPQTHC